MMYTTPTLTRCKLMLALLACATFAGTLSAGTVSTGFSANLPGDPDGYPGTKGAGWAGGWHKGMLPGPAVTAEIRTAVPLSDGGSYLHALFQGIKTDSGIGRSFTRGFGPAAIDAATKVIFEFRIRIETESVGFSGAGDYLTIQCNDQGLVSSSNGSTWILSAFGDSPGAKAGGMQWLMYDGGRNSGAYDKNAWVSSGMPVIPGAVYFFRITADPKVGSYDVEIESGGVTVNREGLGFRTGAKRIGNTIGFFGQLDKRGDLVALSIDDLVITNDLRRRTVQR